MFNSRFKSLKDLQDAFPTEQHCIDNEQAEFRDNSVPELFYR